MTGIPLRQAFQNFKLKRIINVENSMELIHKKNESWIGNNATHDSFNQSLREGRGGAGTIKLIESKRAYIPICTLLLLFFFFLITQLIQMHMTECNLSVYVYQLHLCITVTSAIQLLFSSHSWYHRKRTIQSVLNVDSMRQWWVNGWCNECMYYTVYF